MQLSDRSSVAGVCTSVWLEKELGPGGGGFPPLTSGRLAPCVSKGAAQIVGLGFCVLDPGQGRSIRKP